MKRPYIICHMLSALDGKITGKFMATDAVRPISEAYAKNPGRFSGRCLALWNSDHKGIYKLPGTGL